MRSVRSIPGGLFIRVLIATLLVLCVGGRVLVFPRMSERMSEKLKAWHGKGKDEKFAELTEWKLAEFIVNLADRDAFRYLKVNIVLEIEGKQNGRRIRGQWRPGEAKVRDAIISVLTKRHFQDLLSEQGKLDLKAELKSALNERLDEAEVVNVYFTSFAMQ